MKNNLKICVKEKEKRGNDKMLIKKRDEKGIRMIHYHFIDISTLADIVFHIFKYLGCKLFEVKLRYYDWEICSLTDTISDFGNQF